MLSPAEAGRIIDAARHMTDRTLLMVTYAASLRVSETCALKVRNIDSTRMVLHIEQGKGAKGRLSLLPPELLGQFRHYWRTMLAQLRKHDWVVYAKAPLGGPAQVLEYLARYTHRIAILNERLTSLHDGMVTYAVRNKEPGGPRKRQERLPANVFIQRFMQHVLPSGLKRIRHYGVLANCHKKAKLALCRSALNALQPEPVVIEAIATFMQRVAQIDITCCTSCKTGHFHVTAAISPNRSHATQTSPHQTGPPP